MGRRLFNGRAFSEDGWPYVDQGSCTWVTVPGAAVTLQIQNGPPTSILRAAAADFNAFVEPLRDADSACWTDGNSAETSNHPGATASDWNWNTHPFRVSGTFTAAQRAVIKEIVDFYEGMLGWAGPGYWPNGPVDEMHWQLGYNTYDQKNDRPSPKVFDFIARKIRADGFSTFRRGNVTMPPSDAADVLMRATGITHDKAWDIMVGVINGLRDSECNNVNRIAMWLAQIGHESAGFNATEEYASGAAYEGRANLGNTQPGDGVRFKGRTWIQITGRSNYAQLSKWAFDHGLIPTPTYFVDNSAKLAEIQYAGLGPAWYWTVARPQINSLCDQRNLTAVTQAINGGQNGAADRKARYDRAMALGDQLLTLTTPAPTDSGDDMANVPQDQWDRVYRELTQLLPSRSPLRYLDQAAHYKDGLVDTWAGLTMNVDGMTHVQYVEVLAGYNHPPTMELLTGIANGDPAKYPDRADDIKLAQKILNRVATNKLAAAAPASPGGVVSVSQGVSASDVAQIANAAANAVASQQVSTPAPSTVQTPGGTKGQLFGNALDALDALQSVLTPQGKATVVALIGALQTEEVSA